MSTGVSGKRAKEKSDTGERAGEPTRAVKVFLAGIIQGSHLDKQIHDQEYRLRLKAILKKHLPNADIYCPVENHPTSINYSRQQAEAVFDKHIRQASDSDIVIAYLPTASMGTAIEMWEAHNNGKTVFTISPMTTNWVIQLFSTRNFASFDDFEKFAAEGQLARFVEALL